MKLFLRILAGGLGVALMFSCAAEKEVDETLEVASEDLVVPDMPGGISNGDTDGGGGSSDSGAKPSAEKMRVSSWGLNVRSGPGMQHPVVDVLQRGELVQVLEEVRVWVKIGENRYVASKFLTSEGS